MQSWSSLAPNRNICHRVCDNVLTYLRRRIESRMEMNWAIIRDSGPVQFISVQSQK